MLPCKVRTERYLYFFFGDIDLLNNSNFMEVLVNEPYFSHLKVSVET